MGGEGSGEEKIPQGGCWQQVRKKKGEAGMKMFQKKSYGVVIDPTETQGVGEDLQRTLKKNQERTASFREKWRALV